MSPRPPEELCEQDLMTLGHVRRLLLEHPTVSYTPSQVARELGLDETVVHSFLDYLAELEREYEPQPACKGIAKVLGHDSIGYEALSDNPDVRRDYDYRATNAGGRDLCPKNMFYYVWAWINMLEQRCRENGFSNNHRILITKDCRYYPSEIIEAAVKAARVRGYKVVFALTEGGNPSCVSSYSHAVRVARPAMSIFITASHVSRPEQNVVVGAKVAMAGPSGRLESLSTKEIKAVTARELLSLKSRNDLHTLLGSEEGSYTELDVSESHTRMAVAGTLASLGYIPGRTLRDLAQRLKGAADVDAKINEVMPDLVPPVFRRLRMVIDGSHTASGPLARRAFQALGATTTLLHGEVRELRGPHSADPSVMTNLEALFRAMSLREAQLGMAFDLDGDRAAIVLPDASGQFSVLAPDKLGQVLIPFLMAAGGYRQAPKPVYVRDCLSTDALIEQGRLSNLAIETTDAGYVFLKKRENVKTKEGCTVIGMGEASGHAWLDFTGPFENPIVLALLFAAMCVRRLEQRGWLAPEGDVPTDILDRLFTDLAIPYRKSARFQPIFAPQLIAEVAADARNDTVWSPGTSVPIPQKLINLCRSASVLKLGAFFTPDRVFHTTLGVLKVDKFESQWDDEEEIHRFGKIYFSLDGLAAGSFVTRGSSND
ncbi:MAG: hypothetical protein NTW03_05200, partial [Verrucomicrobia bacterium]|nr:hypothetical protein [Verrucomicrobiota bacterium]